MDDMEKVDKNRLLFSIQAFMMFLNPAAKTYFLSKQKVGAIREKCLELLEKIETGKMDPQQGKEAFNALVEVTNKAMNPKEVTAPYPSFSTLSAKHQLKNEIVAFEYFLNQKFISGEMALETEEPLFKEAQLLWRDTGMAPSPNQGMEKFTSLIEKVNKELDGEPYPLPTKGTNVKS